MAHISGEDGAFFIGTAGDGDEAEETGINSWTLHYELKALDVRDFADAGDPSRIAGIKDWNGTAKGFKDGAPAGLGLYRVQLKESDTANQLWEGDAVITSIDVTTDVDGAVQYSYTFEGAGTLTLATA